MRILLPSATIAAITGATLASSDSTSTGNVAAVKKSLQLARDVDEAYEGSSSNLRKVVGDECNAFNNNSNNNDATNTATSIGEADADVGLLACGRSNQTCVADATSSLGGRCTATASSSSVGAVPFSDRPKLAIFPKRRNRLLHATRFLQAAEGDAEAEDEDEAPLSSPARQVGTGPGADNAEGEDDRPFVCPENCPADFCDCAAVDGDAEVCASQLHSTCEAGLILECVPDKYQLFYEETYCPFAKCLAVENRPYEECSCDYYKDYCDVYYGYLDSVDECAVSTCCLGQEKGSKYTCLPGMAPTYGPTMNPTVSRKPSAFPTITHAPSASTAPTSTQLPSASPTLTTMPTVSSAPTSNPTDFPSGVPSITSTPTTSPTRNPTLNPTDGPTVSPTNAPSDLPSTSPTDVPSSSPSASSAPSTSLLPTDSPTASSEPSASAAPSDVPSTSGAPSLPPSLLPTVTQPPSSNPSTPPPTGNPTVTPTGSPSDVPSVPPTLAPVTESPTKEGTTKQPTKNPTSKPTILMVDIVPVTEDPVEGEERPAPAVKIAASSGMALKSPVAMAASLFMGVGGALWLFS